MIRKHINKTFFGIAVGIGIYTLFACQSGNPQKNGENSTRLSSEVKRIGMVIKLDSTKLKQYLSLHADSNPGVRDLLIKYNMRNFSIFVTQLDDDNYYEFGYYEYIGKNYDADMAALAAEPRNAEWLKICDPLQIPLEGETSWKKMKQVFMNK
jgi:L-rhamnose mutarotase